MKRPVHYVGSNQPTGHYGWLTRCGLYADRSPLFVTDKKRKTTCKKCKNTHSYRGSK